MPCQTETEASERIRERNVVLVHEPQSVDAFLYVIVTAVSTCVNQPLLNHAQPLLRGFIYGALLHCGEEHLDRLISQRTGVRQNDIDLPIAFGQHTLHSVPDLSGGLPISLNIPSRPSIADWIAAGRTPFT